MLVVIACEEVHIAVLEGGVLRLRHLYTHICAVKGAGVDNTHRHTCTHTCTHLLVIEQHPLALLLHMRHVMPTFRIAPHVADDGREAVLSYEEGGWR